MSEEEKILQLINKDLYEIKTCDVCMNFISSHVMFVAPEELSKGGTIGIFNICTMCMKNQFSFGRNTTYKFYKKRHT